MKTALAAVLAAALCAGAAPAALAQGAQPPAETLFRATTLNLAAYGETRLEPDMATITLGVRTEAPTAAQALSANSEQMNRVVAALRAQGIAERDIQTSGLNLSPQYVYEQNQPPRLTGYQASNQVTIRVQDLARLGRTIDAVVGAGANQVHGISFGLKDPAAAENAARLEAVKALQAKAQLYAQATGHRVGRLVSLTEGGGYAPPPPRPMMEMRMMAVQADATPVQGGEVAVRIELTGLYELTR